MSKGEKFFHTIAVLVNNYFRVKYSNSGHDKVKKFFHTIAVLVNNYYIAKATTVIVCLKLIWKEYDICQKWEFQSIQLRITS